MQPNHPFVQAFMAPADDGAGDRFLQEIMTAVRTHLGMDVAFIAKFEGGQRVFTHVSASGAAPVEPGNSGPLEESYCQRVVDGRLPQLIRNAADEPAARELPATMTLPVGAHLSIPLHLRDGSVYGTFCCFSYTPDYSLNARDAGFMRVFAAMVANQLELAEVVRREREQAAAEVRSLIAGRDFTSVYQPIVNTGTGKICGYEALTRFSAVPMRPPNEWFDAAIRVGLGADLEVRTIASALRALDELPRGVYLSVNLSPDTLITSDLAQIFPVDTPWQRLVLELTEHAAIDKYEVIKDKLSAFRARGLRIAVDDAGAGYASFRHILALSPDIIKLDISLVRNIDHDQSRRALAAALVGFAANTNVDIVAEGVETTAELETLKKLGVRKAQGYLLGKPGLLLPVLPVLRPVQRYRAADGVNPGVSRNNRRA
jgi:EAL domain-containing protein (putative c-di-GMP-specific phosphodiesterase class I)